MTEPVFDATEVYVNWVVDHTSTIPVVQRSPPVTKVDADALALPVLAAATQSSVLPL